MNEVAEVATSGGTGIWAAIGSAIAMVVTGVLYVRQRLSKDGTQIASDKAERGMLEFFSRELEKFAALVEKERNARIQAEERADKFAKERNELTKAVGELNGKVIALEATVASLNQDLQEMRGRYEGVGK